MESESARPQRPLALQKPPELLSHRTRLAKWCSLRRTEPLGPTWTLLASQTSSALAELHGYVVKAFGVSGDVTFGDFRLVGSIGGRPVKDPLSRSATRHRIILRTVSSWFSWALHDHIILRLSATACMWFISRPCSCYVHDCRHLSPAGGSTLGVEKTDQPQI